MSGEKTEKPTPKKIREAREKGQVAKSQDLVVSVVFLAVFMVFVISNHKNGIIIKEGMAAFFITATTAPLLGPDEIHKLLMQALGIMFRMIGPYLMTGFVLAAFVQFVQVGALFTMKPLMPKLDKLNPISGFKQKFFSAQTYIECAKSLLKLTIVGSLAYFTIKGALSEIVLTARLPIEAGIKLTSDLMYKIGTKVGIALIMLGAVDVFIQRIQHEKKLKMSKDDVKREGKEAEGDPMYKNRRKQMHQEILSHSMVESVKKADVVIVNPTHIAIAVNYDEEENSAPRVTAKGERLIAEQIIAVAKQYGVPIMRNVPLAHALNELEVGDEIPEELYTAVAEVLQWVYGRTSGSAPPE